MSYLNELKSEYNRYFTKALLAIAKEDWNVAVNNLDMATRRLSEISAHRTGIAKDTTQDWMFDLVEEIKKIDTLDFVN